MWYFIKCSLDFKVDYISLTLAQPFYFCKKKNNRCVKHELAVDNQAAMGLLIDISPVSLVLYLKLCLLYRCDVTAH